MTLLTILFITSIILIFLILTLFLVRSGKLTIKYLLPWYLLSFILLGMIWNPRVLPYLSSLIGIYAPVNFVFFIGFCLCIAMIFYLTTIVSHHRNQIRKLAQQIALMDEHHE